MGASGSHLIRSVGIAIFCANPNRSSKNQLTRFMRLVTTVHQCHRQTHIQTDKVFVTIEVLIQGHHKDPYSIK